MTEQQAAEKTIQERLNARCESLEQYLFDCFMDAKYANAASKAGSVVFLLKRDVETLLEETAKLSGVQFQKGQGWQPIETVKFDDDGFVDVWLEEGYRVTDAWLYEGGTWAHVKDGKSAYISGTPTHWQPLSPAPASIINK